MNVHSSLAFYYTHYQCLGHTARVRTILASIRRKYSQADIHCICGSPAQDYIKASSCFKNHSLPYPLYTRENFLRPPVTLRLESCIRAGAFTGLIKRIRPDIFFTEYFPLGRHEQYHELLPVLYGLRKERSMICASAGYPVIPPSGLKKFRQLSRFYHRIFIHAPAVEASYIEQTYKSRFERAAYRDIFNAGSNLGIAFVNYILPLPLALRKPFDKNVVLKRSRINIVVTRSAGAYYAGIIDAAIDSSEILGEDYNFTIVAGPATTAAEWSGFCRLMARKKIRNAVLIRGTGHMHDLIRESDLCVSSAAYNTSVMLMYYGKKAVLVPFEGCGGVFYREQTARARMMKDVLRAKVIKYEDLSAARLACAIRRILKQGSTLAAKSIDQDWFCGIDRFMDGFSALAAQASSGSQRK